MGRLAARSLVITLVPFFLPLPTTSLENADPNRLLREADRLAMLYNWPKAGPLYAQAETLFAQAGDRKDELYAKLGRIRAQIDTGGNLNLNDNVEEDMRNPLVQGDVRLMVRLLTTKAAIDQETNEVAARDLWERVLDFAKQIDDTCWQARAQAELGIITFLDGDVATATQMLKSALLSGLLHRDFGAVITYGSIVGNGQVEVGQPEAGLKTCNLALKLAAVTRDMGFPYMAYEGKARALIAIHREPEAKNVLKKAISKPERRVHAQQKPSCWW